MKEGLLTWHLQKSDSVGADGACGYFEEPTLLAGTGVLHRNTQPGLTWAARSPSPLPSAMNGLVCLAQWADKIVFCVCYI